MSKLVIELQNDCINPTISYTTLFQKAYFIARKLEQKEMADFLRNEIDGYGNQEIPSFRYINAIFKAKSANGPWKPIILEENDPLTKYQHIPVKQGVPEIESFFNSNNEIITAPIYSELHKVFETLEPSLSSKDIRAHFSKHQYKTILETVKRIISDWSIYLEQKGILGEEYQFSQQEKDIAKTMTIMNFYGSSINGSNVIGSMTNSSATINNNNSFDFEALKQLITKIETDLENAKNIEAKKAASLKEQIALLKKSAEEQNETSAMELLKNIAAGAISSGIWSIGTTVSAFLSSLN